MNIETANRLYEYRKQSGLSQEELAEKIGVSRQAVSKWERAEASPDTDNLIILAKIYGVSLDELINGKAEQNCADSDAAENNGDENSNENDAKSDKAEKNRCDYEPNCDNDSSDNAKSNNSSEKSKNDDFNQSFNDGKAHVNFKNGIHIDSEDGDKVHIGLGGIHVHDKNGDKVDVGWNGIHVVEAREKGDEVHIDKDGVFVSEAGKTRVYTDENGEIIVDEKLRHQKKRHKFFKHFPYPMMCIIAYILFGLFNVCGGWAFGWLVFLTMPLYYSLVDAIIKRKPSHFCYPVLALLVYLICGIKWMLWHPMWILFLTIPVYYYICDVIKKSKR